MLLGNTPDHHLRPEVCQDVAVPVTGVTSRTCIRSAPRAVEWEEPATGVQQCDVGPTLTETETEMSR